MLRTNVLFDLDGTLIDSAPAILASFRYAFAETGVEAVVPIDASIIGPPLAETLRRLSGSEDAQVLDRLAAAFKQHYDTTGLLETQAYEGVSGMLRALAAAGYQLHIATNKRIHPTRLILRALGWEDLFAAVYALDLFEPRLPDKAAMIGRLLKDCGIASDAAIYVGDREEDGLSATANGLPFVAACWGYGSLRPEELQPGWSAVEQPALLVRLLA